VTPKPVISLINTPIIDFVLYAMYLGSFLAKSAALMPAIIPWAAAY
jgi:hypothetical protein